MPAVNITTGFILDLMFGDPYWLPHPVKWIGKFILFLKSLLKSMANRKLAGFILLITVTAAAYSGAHFLSSLSRIIEIFLIYTVFASKSLSFEAKKVYNLLLNGDIASAKKQLGFLVSRDTDGMDRDDIIRATVETISENLVDGIISPMFFLFIGGIPLAMAYKAVNTLDSMVGYKNSEYIDFGYASARLDDVLNYLPARITAFFLLPAAALICRQNPLNALKCVIRDRHNHSSPNSGHPEAAVAGALGCMLGGPAVYSMERVDKPTIGDPLRDVEAEDIKKCITLMYAASIIAVITGLLADMIICKIPVF